MTIIQKGESMTDTELKRRKAICEAAHVDEIDDVSDGFHTFRQLYYQRMMLFAAIVKQNKDKAWKSLRHEDGELCFGGGWFIVGIDTPEGSYTYHYENRYWNMFDCVDLPRAKHWDGHTEADAETRLMSLEPEIKTDGDTISRQAAIDALAKMMPKSYTPDGSHPADEEIFREQEIFADCIKTLEILPSAQPEPRWIPCSERLPEQYGNYLISIHGEDEPDIGTINPNDKRGWSLCDANGFHWASDKKLIVTAWMPLPEPYKEEQE